MTPAFSDNRFKQLDLTPGTTASRLSSTSLRVRAANLITPSGNSAAVGVGPTSAADARSLDADEEADIATNGVIDLKDWYCKAASGSQTLKVVYLPAF